ncbi:cell division protein SepF [Anaerovibrio sp. RM50]|uniref:cell division protein SepF n=1 Tax=Anaerovibrio sp. RM50 TaxID=1200557 RepID=UPI000684D214|nr:cell division protein SepF [Anaerovibrio sp. RM50]
MSILKKLEDFFAPVEVEDELYLDEEEVIDGQVERKVVGGASTVKAVKPAKPSVVPMQKPNLTLYTNNAPRPAEMKIKIFMPQRFDDVREVADALKARSSAIVNYERVELPEQQRICDFLNGVCYIQDGFVHRVSNTMVLYAPNGVEINEMKSVAATL